MESFEEKIEKVKEILTKLNAPDLNLKDSVMCYKDGLKELQEAQDILEQAQLEYETIKNALNKE